MRDNIPDALITAFERQYDSSWNDPQLRNERLAMRYGWAAAIEQKQCLLQIQEPAPVLAAPAAVNPSETPNSSTIAVPRGWKLVPDDATPEWVENLEALPDWREAVGECIKKFLAAAPVAPQAAPAAVAVPDERAAFEAWARWACYEIARANGNAQYESNITEQVWQCWKARAALAATPAADAPLPLLVRDIARELGITCVEACLALKPLGNFSTNTAVTAGMMAKLRECFPERVPASEVAGARERMTAGRACYFMERFLKEEKLLGPNEQAALHYVIDMLEAAAAPVVLPEPDAVLLNQGVELLHALSNDERNRGNCSSAEGATASAYAVQRLAALLATGGQAQELADTVQTVFDALQDKIDARGPISKGNLQYYVNLLREAFDAAPQAQADARDAGEFWGVLSPCGEGVFFRVEADARWTHSGHGSGSDGFGVTTIGEAFRECYEDEELELVRVHIAAIAAAKPHEEPAA